MTVSENIKMEKGESYIDTAIAVFLITMVLIVTINLFSLMMLKQKVNLIADEMIETMTMYGRTGDESVKRIEELKKSTGFEKVIETGKVTFTYDFVGTEYVANESDKVQLGKTMIINVSATTVIKGFGIFQIPVTVSATQSGLSQVYWK